MVTVGLDLHKRYITACALSSEVSPTMIRPHVLARGPGEVRSPLELVSLAGGRVE